ncbi:hypothetical protein ABZ490_13640 [Streptomyces sp. NPDC005811]|uniref:hypothetical protein n=1 Tax=Streptomyces sp. NPDC005811 TaxID=3154565 RepID=UPI0033FD2EE3
MTTGAQDSADPLSAIRQQLQDGEHERRRFLHHPTAPHRLTTVLANTAHVFVYLDGNRRYIHDSHLTSYQEALDADVEKLSTALPGPWGVALRAYATALVGQREEDALLSAVNAVRAQLTADRVDLLSRLGVPVPGGPEAAFARLIGGINAAGSRKKLATAWDRLSDKHLPDLTAAVDRVIDARWSRVRAAGHASPLAATLLRSRLDEYAAEEFLVDYLQRAVATHRDLEATVGATTGCTDDPMNHFAFYLNSLVSGQRMPLIPLSACVNTAVKVIETVFGHRVVREGEAEALVLSLHSADGPSGAIQVDCVPSVGVRVPTLPMDLPIGRALARCRNTDDGRVLTFEAARSLMHEFGHAVNHVLLNPRQPGLTGVEYLPVERLENLSAWFEKWVYHPHFAARVPEPERSRMPLAARIKSTEFRATQLQRAVVAMVDFRVHQSKISVTNAFQQVLAEYGMEGRCHLGDLLPHFGAQVFRVHPGLAGLCYLWSYAYGAEVFRLTDPREALRSCVDPDLPSVHPDTTAMGSWNE